MNPGQAAPNSLALLPTALPADPVTDIRSLLPELKALLNSATNANDDAILEIWLQLCRTMAFLGPSTDRFPQNAIGVTLRTVANAAESVVVIAHSHLSDNTSPCGRAQERTETPRGNPQQPSAT
ncbi:hypothetical protein CGLO_16744 [Colletotrichum gloeosporioides Cg-14]|uniref:Uncharacterized protein n=1 Tax=Colletotrichum gloeosporioides (strain Cg-14) TaxID=1237896 RepID=T0L8L9_COLGC|nr:hypothetical protein CGLO_16744 [Colletotrichum gloeosporioides Cg-14]